MLTGGISQDGGSGGLGGLGGLGSLFSGLVSLTGGGGTLTGGVSSGGSVAPQYYSGGLFGIGAKTLPGLTSPAQNASYADSVQGYALNPPQIPGGAGTLLALSPLSTSMPGVAPYQGSPSTAGGGGTVSTLSGGPSGLGGGGGGQQPGGAAPQSQPGQMQYDAGGNPLYAPVQRQQPGQPLQGGVSYDQPQQGGGFPDWKAQVSSLASGAANFAGGLFGAPAMAANRGNTPSGLVPPPPPMTPSMLAPPGQAAYDPRGFAPQAAMPAMVPSNDTLARATERARQVAQASGSQIAAQVFNNAYANANDVRQDVAKGLKQLQGALKVLNDQMRQPYQAAFDEKFNTPYPQYGGQTLMQYRRSLAGNVRNLNEKINNLAGARPTADQVEMALQVIRAPKGWAGMLQGGADFARAVWKDKNPAIGEALARGDEAMAADANNPVLQYQQAINMASATIKQQAHEDILQYQAQIENLERQGAHIDAEYHAFQGENIKVQDQINQVNKDGLDAFYKQADSQMSALVHAGNTVVAVVQAELANDRAYAQTAALNASTQRAANADAAKADAETRKIQTEMAKAEGAQAIAVQKNQIELLDKATKALATGSEKLSKEDLDDLRAVIKQLRSSGSTPASTQQAVPNNVVPIGSKLD